jgi:hypothetical protein
LQNRHFRRQKKPAGTFRASRHFIFISGIFKCRPALSRMTGILAILKCQPGRDGENGFESRFEISRHFGKRRIFDSVRHFGELHEG